MSDMTFNKLYIFDLKEKKSKRVDFKKGINIITSDKKDGNNRGKSIIMKSLYHTLGADCVFNKLWNLEDKIYLLGFEIEDKKYFMYRNKEYFKLYNESKKVLFEVKNRDELGVKLSELYGFKIELPDRNGEVKVTPPVYSYLLNYIDQDKQRGVEFASFEGLGQYPKYRQNLLYTYMNAYDKQYFELLKNKVKYDLELNKTKKDIDINKTILNDIQESLKGLNILNDIEVLKEKLKNDENEYRELLKKLEKVNNSLIKYENTKIELDDNIEKLNESMQCTEKIIFKDSSKCSKCNSKIDNSLEMKVSNANDLEDYIILQEEFKVLKIETEKNLNRELSKYEDLIKQINKFKQEITFDENSIEDILTHKAYIELNTKIQNKNNTLQNQYTIAKENLEKIEKSIKEYNSKRASVNSKYNKGLSTIKQTFGLKEVDINKKIYEKIKVTGSNISLFTFGWFVLLIKIRDEISSNMSGLPVVFDSPKNTDLDSDRTRKLFDFIFSELGYKNQLIVSSVGFDESEYKDYDINNIINLKNEANQLLDSIEYDKNLLFLREFI